MIDHELEFDAPLKALTTGTAYSAKKLYFPGDGDIAINTQPLYLQCYVDAAFVSGGSSTLTVSLETSVDEAFTSPITLLTSGAVAKATLVKGYKIFDAVIPEGCKQWFRMKYVVAVADFTAGSLNARINTNHGQKYNPA